MILSLADLPSSREIEIAIRQLKNKSPRSGLYSWRGSEGRWEPVVSAIQTILEEVWEKEQVPQDCSERCDNS